MKYIYGPVESRRLGFSLGVSLTPYKTCDFDCVYCQLGPTKEKVQERKEYVKKEEILDELRTWLGSNPVEVANLKYITLSGMGEPTLNIQIGEIISEIKKITQIPIAVITNASLLSVKDVRASILGADLIVPSLDAGVQNVFQKIDRPVENIKVEDIIEGLVLLRKEFRGQIWLEVMLVRGFNDHIRHIRKLKVALEKINPDKIQLNCPVRTTAEKIFAPEMRKMKKIQAMLGEKAEVV